MLKIILISILAISVHTSAYTLKQVVVLGRHSIRAPFADYIDTLTMKQWPKFSAEIGHLTPNGAKSEELFGNFFREYLKKDRFISDECPNEDFIYVLANNTQRTIKTATVFTNAIFKDCKVPIHTIENGSVPIFNAVIRDGSEEFINKAYSAIEDMLNQLHLDKQYKELNNILNISDSEICKDEDVCDLVKYKNEIKLIVGSEPFITGALDVATSVCDTFLMLYYDGMPLKKIAWGAFRNIQEFAPFIKIVTDELDVKFGSQFVARHVAKPYLEFISETFKRELPLTILVGHDTNLHTFAAAVGVKQAPVLDQYSGFPIGSKIVLQKWFDEKTQTDLFKAVLMYQSTYQLRNLFPISLENPPIIVDLQIEDCVADRNGFCKWDDFITVFEKSL